MTDIVWFGLGFGLGWIGCLGATYFLILEIAENAAVCAINKVFDERAVPLVEPTEGEARDA